MPESRRGCAALGLDPSRERFERARRGDRGSAAGRRRARRLGPDRAGTPALPRSRRLRDLRRPHAARHVPVGVRLGVRPRGDRHRGVLRRGEPSRVRAGEADAGDRAPARTGALSGLRGGRPLRVPRGDQLRSALHRLAESPLVRPGERAARDESPQPPPGPTGEAPAQRLPRRGRARRPRVAGGRRVDGRAVRRGTLGLLPLAARGAGAAGHGVPDHAPGPDAAARPPLGSGRRRCSRCSSSIWRSRPSCSSSPCGGGSCRTPGRPQQRGSDSDEVRTPRPRRDRAHRGDRARLGDLGEQPPGGAGSGGSGELGAGPDRSTSSGPISSRTWSRP